MNILVVNDDGYQSPNLEVLVKALAIFGNVYVAAPETGQSGKSMAISIRKNIHVFYPDPIIGSKSTIAVDGTPADCVSIGLKAFHVDFDLCVSGINIGHNIATDVYYSGTVGAAREAKFKDIPAIAVSASHGHIEYLYDETVKLFDEIFESKIYLGTHILNINFPHHKFSKPQGVRITKLGKKHQYSDFVPSKDNHMYVPNYSAKHFIEDADSDVQAIQDGFISITPLSFDSTDYVAIKRFMNPSKG